MKMKMNGVKRWVVAGALALSAQVVGAAEYGAYVHINPWFPADPNPKYDYGGPNVPWVHHEGPGGWVRMMKTAAQYGITGFRCEINAPGLPINVYQELLAHAGEVPGGFKVGALLVFGGGGNDPVKAADMMIEKLLPVARTEWRTNPHVERDGERVVAAVYAFTGRGPDFWAKVFARMREKLGPMKFLFSYSDLLCHYGIGRFEEKLREYMPVADGLWTYASSFDGVITQRKMKDVLERVMKEFPEKTYEGNAFFTYTMHFTMEGQEVHLSRNWRESVDMWLASSATAIDITNWYDHCENSAVYPCYEREDFVLRYFQYAIDKKRGVAFPKEKTPELVICNPTTLLLGWQPIDIEVLGFPIDAPETQVEVAVELCNTKGEVLRTLGPRTLDLRDFASVDFQVPSTDFADERGIVPRLVWTWQGKEERMNSQMTLISPSMRCHHLYWARNTKNRIKTLKANVAWRMNGAQMGETFTTPADGYAVIAGQFAAERNYDVNAPSRHTLKRDWTEVLSIRDNPHPSVGQLLNWSNTFALPVVSGGKALHWYNLEIQLADGKTATTLPVWEAPPERCHKVKMPIFKDDGTIAEMAIEEARVPYFHYPLDRDAGRVLLDVSGYEHNGVIGSDNRWSEWKLGYTGYNHCHNGPLPQRYNYKTLFRRAGSERGYLHFGGKDWAVFAGNTAFAGACTYEIAVRPETIGAHMGLIEAHNKSIHLAILPDGKVRASRRVIVDADWKKNSEPSVTSTRPLAAGEWARLAVVYDLKELTLYVNGEKQGAVAAPCRRLGWQFCAEERYVNSPEQHTYLIVGSEHQDYYTPRNCFVGDIRDLRFYGRNLAPEEFLK